MACPTGLPPLHVDDVRLRELVEAVLAVRAADAALAPTGVEALHSLKIFAIDVRFAEVDLLAGAQGRIQIARVNAGSETVIRIVGEVDGLVQVVKRHHRDHWPEDLLANNLHL